MSKATNAATKEQLISLMEYISQNISIPTVGIGGGYAPIGTIISYMGTTAPQDYLVCDGTTYNIADYKQLADFFAAQFGSSNFFGGDGVTTFKVPDLRGEFLRGTGTNGHENQGSGANVGVHQNGTKHLNVFIAKNRTSMYVGAEESEATMTGAVGYDYRGPNVNYRASVSTVASTTDTANNAYTSRPTNTSVLYCIKAVAAGDVYSTSERVVGTWIDGKPIYQKTINFGALPNATIKDVAHGITNIDNVIDVFGIAAGEINSTKYSFHLPSVGVHTSLAEEAVKYNMALTIIGANIRIQTGIDRSSFSAYVTIRYTKTTD